MVFIDWTFSGDGSGVLDTSVKYAGNSSYRSIRSGSGNTNLLTHNTFSEPQAQIITWAYSADGNAVNRIKHDSYGILVFDGQIQSTWEKFRVTFWYDTSSNTKWGRVEKWIASAWVQQGGDTNFGAGSPVAGAIALTTASTTLASRTVYFDEVEVYS